MLQTSITGTSTSTRPKSVQQVSPPLDYASSAVGNAPPLPTGYLSTYKGLNFERSDNLFVELEVTNGTSVHFEIQQCEFCFRYLFFFFFFSHPHLLFFIQYV